MDKKNKGNRGSEGNRGEGRRLLQDECVIEGLMDKKAAAGGARETETLVGILIESLIPV